jgi:hypothetical protein
MAAKNLHSEHVDRMAFAEAIAQSLQAELGQSHRAIKTLMRWTGASARTSKNWLAGSCGPCGHHLVELTRESDAVLATLLSLAGRDDHKLLHDLSVIREPLRAAVIALDQVMPPIGAVRRD